MNKTHFKRATTLTLVVTLVLCQGFVTGTPLTQVVSNLQRYVSGPGTITPTLGNGKLPRAAQLSVKGVVTLNGMTTSDGATVFSGAGVQTKEDSSAVLSFGQMGQVELANASDFTLALEGTTLGGQLRVGSATIVAPAGVAVKIVTPDGPILTDGREAIVLTVEVTAGKARVESNHSLTDVTLPMGYERMMDDQGRGCARGPLSAEEKKKVDAYITRLRFLVNYLNKNGGSIDVNDVDRLVDAARKGDRAEFEAVRKRILDARPKSQKTQLNLEEMREGVALQRYRGPSVESESGNSVYPPIVTGDAQTDPESVEVGNEMVVGVMDDIGETFGMFGGGGMAGGGSGGFGGGGAGGGGIGGLGALLAGGIAAAIAIPLAISDDDPPVVSPMTP